MNESIKEIEEVLNFLTKHYDKYVSDVKIKPYISKLEKYKNSPLLIKAIQQRHRPTEIHINTVGAYLWGCSQHFYGDTSQNCSALCATSISHSFGTLMSEESLNCKKCQYSIWTYTNSKLNNDFHTSSSKAYIYVDSDWIGFTNNDIETLKKSGILFATLFSTNYSQHQILLPMTSIDNLPISKGYIAHSAEEKIVNESYWWLFIPIIIVFILFFIYLNYYYLNST